MAEPPIAETLISEGWAGLEPREHGGYLLFPDYVLRRRAKGVERIKVMLRVPREPELRRARLWARHEAKHEGLDLDRDQDLVTSMENLYLLTICIRNAEPDHEQWVAEPMELERDYDRASLLLAWSKIDKLHAYMNPADADISPAQMLTLMARLASERHLGPLAGYGPDAQRAFVLSMVDQVLSSMAQRSSQELLDSPTPGASASNDSAA